MQAELEPLSRRYDVVVANPPYMGSSSLGKWVGAWVKKHYPEAYRDLCTCFIDRGFGMSSDNGYSAMVTMQSWMFLGSFEKLRGKILRNHSISSMAHLGTRAFGAIGGEVVSTTATAFANAKCEVKGAYFRLVDMGSEEEKQAGLLEALANPDCGWFYRADANSFEAIPGSPIAYWASKAMIRAFSIGKNLREYAYGCNGMTTGENAKFLRLWFEVSAKRIAFDLKQETELTDINAWVPYNKGGDYQKWANHCDYVLNWHEGGSCLKNYGHLVMRSKNYMLKPGFTWSKISSGHIAMRAVPKGFMFDVAGLSLFPNDANYELFIEAFVNSSVASAFLSFLSPTLNFEVGNVTALPIIDIPQFQDGKEMLVSECNHLTVEFRNMFETSWGFVHHPLV